MPLTLVLAPLAAYLLLYAPGHYLLRLSAPAGRRSPLLFREVLLSVCCASWIGFILAELSIYSIQALLSVLAVVAAAAAFFGRGRPAGHYRVADLIGVAVVVGSWLWLLPPLDTRILGADSSGYLAAGVHLSRHGSLIIHDPTIPLLSPTLKFALFPTVTVTPWVPPYLRLPGSMILRNMTSDEVLLAFHHLMAVWVAIFHGIAGSPAAQWAITLFGGLSVWAMVEFASAACGGFTAVVFFLLLSFSAIQNWYSRFLMPEIPAQYFLWGGLACVSFWRASQRRSDAILAGVAFGIAGLMRTENAAFGFFALAFGLYFVGGAMRSQRRWLLACATFLWLHAAFHLMYFRTHYVGILSSLVPETGHLFAGAPWQRLAVLLAGIVLLVAWRYRRNAGMRTMLPAMLLTGIISIWGEWQHGWTGLGLIVAYIGAPTLLLGALGFGLLATATLPAGTDRRILCALAALAVAQFLLAPHATPVPIWVIRRAATIVLPVLCLGVAYLCVAAARRLHWAAAVLILAVAISGEAKPFADLRWPPYYQGSLSHVRGIAAKLPPDACVLYDKPLMAWGIAQTLWAERDMPAYVLTRFDPLLVFQVVRAVDGTLPVYWVTESRWLPPQLIGFSVTRVGTYSFSLLTPTLDEKTQPGAGNRWNRSLAIYEMRPVRMPPKVRLPGRSAAPAEP